jgi:hypothetical protein
MPIQILNSTETTDKAIANKKLGDHIRGTPHSVRSVFPPSFENENEK